MTQNLSVPSCKSCWHRCPDLSHRSSSILKALIVKLKKEQIYFNIIPTDYGTINMVDMYNNEPDLSNLGGSISECNKVYTTNCIR